MYFYELKSLQMEATTQYFGKRFFCKQVLELHRPSKFYARHLGVKINGPYYPACWVMGTYEVKKVREKKIFYKWAYYSS